MEMKQPSVRRMLHAMDADELPEWLAYLRIRGIVGPRRDDMRTGYIVWAIMESQRGKGSPSKPADWFPDFETKRPQTEDEMRAVFRMIGGG